jgi:hypothetical protein
MITRKGLDIGNVVDNLKNDFLNVLLTGSAFPGSNVLHQYRTFNYRVTLAIVSSEEKASQSYKSTGFDYIIFQSHGKNSDGITPGGSAVLNKIQSFVNTATSAGKNTYNFYLDDLYIHSYMGGGRDFATSVKMKIVEPYSMDTFLSSIMTGLAAKGFKTFDKSCCFVLKIDFVGYREESDEAEVVPYTTRYYPIAITTLNANLTSQGTVYELTGAPLNDFAKHDDVNIVSESMTLKGKTVGDMIQSLEDTLNKLGEARKTDSGIVPNKYKIIFVNEKDEEVSAIKDSPMVTSAIKASNVFNTQDDAGVRDFLKDKTKYTSVKILTRNENSEEPEMSLTVNGQLGITTIIDGLICDSYFLVDRLKVNWQGYYDPEDNQLSWWRVIPNIENGRWIQSLGAYQKFITFKIVPRKVHYTKLTSIFVPDHVAPASAYDSMIARTYEWNYTGNNKDILSFNINFNQLWAKLITGSYGKKTEQQGASKGVRTQDGIDIKGNDGEKFDAKSFSVANGEYTLNKLNKTVTGEKVEHSASTTGFNVATNSSNSNTQLRTSAETNPLWDLSRDVFAIINNPNEQISLNMEILGDPMWLGTQFIDDSARVGGGSKLFTVDGGIAIRTVDPVIRVLAYSPRDINAEGFIAPNKGETKALSSYSAHYTINEIESFFQNGVFKQRIKGNRNTIQDLSKLNATVGGNTGDRFSWQKIDLSIR